MLLLSLPMALTAFKLLHERPASSYADAMAKGQYNKASEFIKLQVNENNPQAQNALANLHYLGLGVAQNHGQAARLYHAAASKGFAAAQLNMGHLYRQGLGVPKNVERAFAWYVHSNISGNPWAEYYMSLLSVELTLTPLQMATTKERWQKLDQLAAEPL